MRSRHGRPGRVNTEAGPVSTAERTWPVCLLPADDALAGDREARMKCAHEVPIGGTVGSDDPHIAAYLKRQAVLTGELETSDEIAAFAVELGRDLPDGPPPPSIVAFISADIKITLPPLTDQLWTP